MPIISINYLAVLISAIVQQALGAFWYSPSGFGKQWMALMGIDDVKAKTMKDQGGMGQRYAMAFVGALIMMYALAWFIDAAGATTFMQGALTGFWLWLGFLATSMMGSVLWENKPPKLYFINSGYYLVSLILNGGVLAVWI